MQILTRIAHIVNGSLRRLEQSTNASRTASKYELDEVLRQLEGLRPELEALAPSLGVKLEGAMDHLEEARHGLMLESGYALHEIEAVRNDLESHVPLSEARSQATLLETVRQSLAELLSGAALEAVAGDVQLHSSWEEAVDHLRELHTELGATVYDIPLGLYPEPERTEAPERLQEALEWNAPEYGELVSPEPEPEFEVMSLQELMDTLDQDPGEVEGEYLVTNEDDQELVHDLDHGFDGIGNALSRIEDLLEGRGYDKDVEPELDALWTAYTELESAVEDALIKRLFPVMSEDELEPELVTTTS